MKRAFRNFLVIVLMLGTSGFLSGREIIKLTLEECLRLALSRNPFFLASQEKVRSAQSQLREAAGSFLPTLNAQGMQTLDEKLFVLEFPSFFPDQPPQRVKMDFTRDYQFALSFSLPVFTGGRLVAGYNQAKYNLMSTKESVRLSEHETVFNVKRAFYGYLLAAKFVEVAEEAVALAEKHFQSVKNLNEVGMASKFDLLRSEVQLANLKPQLIRARNSLDITELSLKTLLGLDLSQPIEVSGELAYQPFEADEESIAARALLLRPEINQLKHQRQMAGELFKLARASYFPTLAVGGSFNFWADKLSFKEGTWQNYYSINLVLNVPLFSGFSSPARVAQSQAMVRELELNQKGLSEMVKFEVRQSLLNLKQARESLFSQEKNVEQARESVRIAELNYAEGLATSLDVSSAQVALTQAKTNYSQALYDYVISLAQLDKAVGSGWNGDEKKQGGIT